MTQNSKKTNIPWIGEIPEDWETRYVKSIFRELSIKNRPNEKLLLASQSQGVIYKEEYGTQTTTALVNLESLKLVEIGNFVISLRSFQGGIEIAYRKGIISPAYTVFSEYTNIDKTYFKYLFKDCVFIQMLNTMNSGIRDGQSMSFEDFKYKPLPFPPLDIQTAIANFLDQKTIQIKKFIENKKKLINLLKEQKQSIIHRAVTKGIDKNVKMKKSGVSWIGEMPEDFDTRRIKSIILKSKNGAWGDDPKGNSDDIICIRVADFDKNNFGINDQNLTYRNITNCDDIVLSEGDLILEKSGGGDSQLVGRVIYFNKSYRAVTSNFLATIKTKKDLIMNSYFYYVLKACYDMGINYRSIKQTTGIQNLDSDSYFQEQVPLPSIETQKAIVEYIEKETAQIDTAIEKIEKEIALIEEYRTSLIYQAVTGKISIS